MDSDLIAKSLQDLVARSGASIDAPDLATCLDAFKLVLVEVYAGTRGGAMVECGRSPIAGRAFVHLNRFIYVDSADSWDDCMFDCTFEYDSHVDIPEISHIEGDISDTAAGERLFTLIAVNSDLWLRLGVVRATTALIYVGSQ